jgi:hypothetical protein
VLKGFHQALLSLKQTFIHGDYGVNLVRLVFGSLLQYQVIPLNLSLTDTFVNIFLLRSMIETYHQDLTIQPRYLVTFTVGIGQKANIDAAVKKVII